MKEREKGRDVGRGRSTLQAGSPMWDSIPGPQDHDLSRRQMLNQLSLPGAACFNILKYPECISDLRVPLACELYFIELNKVAVKYF